MSQKQGKGRTFVGAQNGAHQGKAIDRSPKSMVIRIGASEIGSSVSQLVKDVRRIMEPGTASRLKERRGNKLRDYTSMCGPLGVTHLLLFSKTTAGNTNLRLGITPRGPTLHFHVDNYSLCKDILKSQRHPITSSLLYQEPPLLVMNNFASKPADLQNPGEPQVPKHLESLVTTVFQSLFPPLAPQSTPLSSIKRVLLLNREPPSDPSNGTYTITLRHFAISIKTTGASRPVRRLNNAAKAKSTARKGKNMPNLGQLEDVADYLLDPETGNYTSASESEPETDAEVEILAKTRQIYSKDKLQKKKMAAAAGRPGLDKRPGVEKRAVKLSEIGPRIRLNLFKVEEGLCEGKVMWHEYVSKTREEVKAIELAWEKRNKQKAERKRIQRENVERKRKEKAGKKKRGGAAGGEDDEDEEMDDYEDWDSEDYEVAADQMEQDEEDSDEEMG